jgi:hypothetical protein
LPNFSATFARLAEIKNPRRHFVALFVKIFVVNHLNAGFFPKPLVLLTDFKGKKPPCRAN